MVPFYSDVSRVVWDLFSGCYDKHNSNSIHFNKIWKKVHSQFIQQLLEL
jgi:hypothetical protein